MAKTQLNIRVGAATREKIDWLRTRYGSQAQAVAVAVDRLYQDDRSGPMHILVEVDDASLFDSSDSQALQYVNHAASATQFCTMLRARLETKYPGATITIWEGPGRITVNAEPDHDEVPWIEQQVNDVWLGWEWVIEEFPTD